VFHAPYGCEPVKGVLKMVRASVNPRARMSANPQAERLVSVFTRSEH
jgi:hypothetical protein